MPVLPFVMCVNVSKWLVYHTVVNYPLCLKIVYDMLEGSFVSRNIVDGRVPNKKKSTFTK